MSGDVPEGYEEVDAPAGYEPVESTQPSVAQNNASAEAAMAGPEGKRLREELQHAANRRLLESKDLGPGYAALSAVGNTAFLNAPRNIIAYGKSLASGRPFHEEYDKLRRIDEAAAEENPKSTLAGEAAGTVGQALTIPAGSSLGIAGRTALGGLTGGLLEGAKTYADTKDVGQALKQGAISAVIGAAATPVVEKIAAPVARWIGEKAGLVAPKVDLPTKDEFFDLARDAYKRSENEGVMIRPEAIRGALNEIQAELASKGYHPKLTPELQTAIDELYKSTIPALDGKPNYTTLAGLDVINQMARNASTSINPQSRLMGGIFHEKLSDFLENLKPQDIISGDAQRAVDALNEGRGYWKTARKVQELENRFDDAALRAARTGSGGNINNTLRQEISKIIAADKKRPGRWTKDEIAAMRQIVKGTPTQNAARLIGKLSPGGNGLALMLEMGAAFNNPSTLAAPVIGNIGKITADNMTRASIRDLHDLIRAGGLRVNMPDVGPGKIATGAKNLGITGGVSFQPEERPAFASGGRIDKRDYPAKRATLIERQAMRERARLGDDLKPIMNMPDHSVVNALRLANGGQGN